MRIAVTAAVLLAVVATAVVTVCQQSETRHLQYRVWRLERRRESLARDGERLRAAIDSARTPRRLLVEQTRAGDVTAAPPLLSNRASEFESPFRTGGFRTGGHDTADAALFPEGFNPGDNFEGGDR